MTAGSEVLEVAARGPVAERIAPVTNRVKIEDWLSWIRVSSQARCSFHACDICLQGWVLCHDIAFLLGRRKIPISSYRRSLLCIMKLKNVS